MEDFLNRGIKEIIRAYPEAGKTLEEYGIGCVPCQVGTCRLRDIVEIHGLDPEAERRLLTRLAHLVQPGWEIDLPPRNKAIQRKSVPASPPINLLMKEHLLIKRLLAVIPAMAGRLKLPADGEVVRRAVDFIRNYADSFHHAKEEEILFKYFDESLEIIRTMRLDHEAARDHVMTIVGGVERNEEETVRKHLLAYRELLADHIRREDEILYPWMDGRLDLPRVGRLYGDFMNVKARFNGVEEKYKKTVESIESMFYEPKSDIEGMRRVARGADS